MNLTIIVNDAPYGIEKPWNALRLASTSASIEMGMNVKVFLMGDSVVSAKKGQRTPEGYYNMEKMLRSLVNRGVEVQCCGACIDARGIEESELVEGVKRGSMKLLASWVKECDKLLSF